MKDLPLIVITGPTASGKTAVAIRLAKEFNGEIICADSRTIYRGMDIGTAKPTVGEMQGVPHWGLDLVAPGERFTVVDFKEYAVRKISEIRQRGHVPFLVGGTGLYIDSVVLDYQFPEIDEQLRAELEKLSIADLRIRCNENNIKLPENDMNKRHLISTIMRNHQIPYRKDEVIDNCIVVAISTDLSTIKQRITDRANGMFASGMIEEAVALGKRYGWGSEAMTGNIYPIVKRFVDGQIDEAQVRREFIRADYQLARRQLTWLRRNDFVRWFALESAYTFLKQYLTK